MLEYLKSNAELQQDLNAANEKLAAAEDRLKEK